ncbi:chitin deacetylase [Gryganskiella cystojenkinii]|nr:chitin deacetylase [Gryganskiella cystojenkinii]
MVPFLRLTAAALMLASMIAVNNAAPAPFSTYPVKNPALTETNNSPGAHSLATLTKRFEHLNKRGSGKLITACTTPGTVAITFDDGPFEFTHDLLDKLDQLKVKVTFFMNGDNYSNILDEEYQAIVKRADKAGHQIASHTWDHANLDELNDDEIRSEMKKLDDAFIKILGKRPVYMRPPFGDASSHVQSIISGLGYKMIKWNIDTEDWEHPTTVDANLKPYRDALGSKDALKKGWIGLEHDVNKDTATELSVQAITLARELLFKVEPVAVCLGDTNSKNWYRK